MAKRRIKFDLTPGAYRKDKLKAHKKSVYNRFRERFIEEGAKTWVNGKDPDVRKLLGEIWDINKKYNIQDIVLGDIKPTLKKDELIKVLKEKIEIWNQLYGREVTFGSYAMEPMPWKYIKALVRYFINPTNAAVFVMFFTMYSTYYWLDHQAYTVSLATDTISGLITGIMTFMLTMTLSSGKDKEKEVIKKFEALSGDVKALAMYLVHASYDHQKYIMEENGSLKYDNRVRDQFHKMQYLLAVLSPTARKVLQGSRSFLFPEYLGDSNSFFRDLVNGRINGKNTRYFKLSVYGFFLTLTTLAFVVTVLANIVVTVLYGVDQILISVSLVLAILLTYFAYWTRWKDFRLCGWGCCCKSTPYADVDDLELIPFTTLRDDSSWNFLYVFCCLNTKYKRNYRRWSDPTCSNKGLAEDEFCTKGLEYALYNKIRETQSKTEMDLFETEMTVLLDEINKIGELKIGFGKQEASAVLAAVLNKWEGIYGNWGEMSSVKTYREPTLIQMYRVVFIFLYAFIAPIKYLTLHENNNHWCILDCGDGKSIDPYIWWSLIDVSIYAVLWWVAYYVRNPFDKELWFGRSDIVVQVSTSTQRQVNRFVMNAKHLEEQDYTRGFRYGWGGKGNNPFPIGYTALKYRGEKDKNGTWGEMDVNVDDVTTAEDLQKIAGQMYDYRKVINTMFKNLQIYTSKRFEQELLATAYNRITSEKVLNKFVALYVRDVQKYIGEKKSGKVTTVNITILGINEELDEEAKQVWTIVDVRITV